MPHILYPCLLQYAFLRVGLLRPKKVKMTILNNITSILKPGRATLLLGPPAAGKSTLLKALSGKLAPHGLKVRGKLQGLCEWIAEHCLSMVGISVLINALRGKLAQQCLQVSFCIVVSACYAERGPGVRWLVASHHWLACRPISNCYYYNYTTL